MKMKTKGYKAGGKMKKLNMGGMMANVPESGPRKKEEAPPLVRRTTIVVLV